MTPVPDRTLQDWPRIYLGVFLTSLATLLLELALTRLFSVVFYYHFAFLAISIALFGLGAGGLFSYLTAQSSVGYTRRAAYLLLANVLVIPAALFLFLRIEAEPGPALLVGVFFAAAVPFFLAGAVLSSVISETIDRVDRVYFYDLLGAAAGCLLLVPFLNNFGGPNTVLAAAVTYAAAASLWFSASRMVGLRAFAVGVALVLVCLMVVNGKTRVIDLRYAKGKALGEELFVKWNSFSRVALRQQQGQRQPDIVIDGDASTGIPPFDIDRLSTDDRKTLLSMGPGFVYRLRPAVSTLILGSGGGWDVARALAGGSKDVTAVEINPAIADTIMRERYPELSKRLYFRPEVHLNIEDGRSFVRRTDRDFGVLQLTLVDTWASTAAGAFALTENNLYTTEAMRDYLSVLAPDGVLSFSRWGFTQPRESLRLIALALAAFESQGVRDISRHVMVIRENTRLLDAWGSLDTILIARSPFSEADLASAKQNAQEQNLDVVYLPGEPGNTAFHQLLATQNPRAFYAAYPYDVSPVGDNRPFFFYTVQSKDWWSTLRMLGQGAADYNINKAVPTLFALFGASVLATIAILLLPRFVLKTRLPQDSRVRGFLGYFVLIGAGYILVQISAIQRFVLLLGHPTYSLTVIVFSMLIFTGLGSFLSRRLVGERPERLRAALFLAALEVAILAVVVGPFTEVAVGWPTLLKVLCSVAMIGIPAFTMGLPFPMGLKLIERWHAPSVRWAWALNAAASVLGSASAMVIAISFGLRETMLAGRVCYLLAAGSLWLMPADRKPSGVGLDLDTTPAGR